MNIKKILLFTTIIGLSLGLSSCGSFSSRLIKNDEKTADARFKNIIEAIEKKDKEGLKKMFSPSALNEAKDIDDGIEYIMKFYKGKMKSRDDGTVITSDSKNEGAKKSELRCGYTVTTDEDTYIVFFIDQIVNTKSTDDIGLYMLQIIKESDKKKEFDGGGEKTRCAGIYRPQNTTMKEENK